MPMDESIRCNRSSLWLRAWALLLGSIILTSCFHRKVEVKPPAAPPPPTQPSAEAADRHFKAGEYLGAAQAYEAFLNANPKAQNRDRILFRLAISYALAGGEPENFRKSLSLLRTVFIQFPDSEYKAETEYILSLQTDIDRLRVDLREKSDLVREQNDVLEQQAAALASRDKSILDRDKLLKDKDRLLREKERALAERDKSMGEMEDKLLKLSQELEQMKKIDLERKPSRPPGY